MPIGQARIKVQDDIAEISYSIIPEKQAMGRGSEILSKISNEVLKEFPDVEKIVGKVKTDNIASQKALEKVGYVETYRVFEKVL